MKTPSTLILRKILRATFLLIFFALNVSATTWETAYPYKQKIEGQKVVVSAFPYDPYSGSPMIGLTKIYYDDKLLYTLDRYYREKIFTSSDGQYLAVVHTSNFGGVSSYVTFGIERINFDEPAIEIFKSGLPFKTFSLLEIIDTAKLLNNGQFFNWGYDLDYKAFGEAVWGCNFCKKDLTRKEMKDCLNGVDTDSYCKECIRQCDSVKLFEREKYIYNNSMYVKDNSLFIITNQGMILTLNFTTLEVQHIPIDKSILESYSPPKLIRKYKKVKLPGKFDEPNLSDGRSLEKGIADLFGLAVPKNTETKSYCAFIDNLILDRNGKCVSFYGKVNDERISKYNDDGSQNIEMTEKLNHWVKAQTFQTKLIPKGFDGYSFLCIVYLK